MNVAPFRSKIEEQKVGTNAKRTWAVGDNDMLEGFPIYAGARSIKADLGSCWARCSEDFIYRIYLDDQVSRHLMSVMSFV